MSLVEVKKGWLARHDELVQPSRDSITKRAFMQRFTQPERTLIRKSTDDIVIDIHEDLKAVDIVTLSDQDVIDALTHLTLVGILAIGRSDTILNTPVEEGEI